MRPAWPYAFTVLLLAGLLSPLVPPASAASSETVATIPLPPATGERANGIVGTAAAYYNGHTYVFGGRMLNPDYSDAVYDYDHSTRTVTRVATMPTAAGASNGGRQSAAAAVLGDKIYVFGGAVIVEAQLRPPPDPPSPVPQAVKDILEFDPRTGSIRTIGAKLPAGIWGLQAVTYGDRVYLLGGFSFDVSSPDTIERLDWILEFRTDGPLGPTVRKLDATLPFPVQDGAVALIGSRIYYFGGLGNHDNETNVCPRNRQYNATSGQYEETDPVRVCSAKTISAFTPDLGTVDVIRAKLPGPGQFLTAAVVNGKAYIPGGRLADGTASDKILEFAPSALNPIRVLVPTLPKGMMAMSSTTDGNVVMLFGGRGSGLTDMSANVTMLDPRPTPPWSPRALIARAGAGQVTLTWEPPAYDGDSPVTGYRVYRTQEGAAEVYLGETTALTYADTGAKPAAQYVYRVAAQNAVGEGAGARASTLSGAVPPGPVGNLVAYPGNEEVVLRWSPPTDTGGANLTGYRVYRDEDPLPVANVPAGTLEHRDAGLTNGQPYSYVVRAVNSKGEGAAPVAVRATPKPVPPAPSSVSAEPVTDGVAVTWELPAGAIRELVVLRGTDPSRLVPIANLSGTQTTYEDPAPERGRTYYYAVAAVNDVGESPPSELAAVALVSKPSPPQNLFAAALEGGVRLTWQPPAEPGVVDTNLLSYIIVKNGRRVAADVRGTAWTDSPLVPGQTHTYRVIAFNGLESDPSNEQSRAAKAIENKPPVATVAILTTIINANDTVDIDGSQSMDPDGTIAEYVWDFGDGSPIERTPTSAVQHAYARNATYTVTLVAKDNRGDESAPATALVIVGEPLTKADDPNAELTPSTTPTNGPPGSKSPKLLPAPGLVALLALLALAALARRR